jgi:hypothetical protein
VIKSSRNLRLKGGRRVLLVVVVVVNAVGWVFRQVDHWFLLLSTAEEKILNLRVISVRPNGLRQQCDMPAGVQTFETTHSTHYLLKNVLKLLKTNS